MIKNSFRLLIWLLIRPSQWRQWAQKAGLSPTVCLLEVKPSWWRQPILKTIVWRGYVVLPAIAALSITLVLGLSGRHPLTIVSAFAIGWGIGLLLGAIVNMASGIVAATIVGVVTAIAFSQSNLLLVDVAFTTRIGWLFGTTCAILIHVTRMVSAESAERLWRQQLGGIVLGLVVTAALFGTTVSAFLTLISFGHSGGIDRNIIRWVVGGLPALVLAVATWWRTRRWRPTLAIGIIALLFFVYWFGTTGYEYDVQPSGRHLMIAALSVSSSIFLMLLALAYNLTERLIAPVTAAITATLAGGATLFVWSQILPLFAFRQNFYVGAVLVVLAIASKWVWSVCAYPLLAAWHTAIYRLDRLYPNAAGTRLYLHSVFWDELQQFKQAGLDAHLLLAVESNPQSGMHRIEKISKGKQRWAAQAAQIELDAQQLEDCTSVETIGLLHTTFAAGFLTGPASMILFRFKKLSEDVAAALAQPTRFNQRLVLQTTANQLNNLAFELQRSDERYHERFLPIVEQWHQIVSDSAEMLQAEVVARHEIPNPYVIGVPLTRRQAVFVGRTDISSRIEGFLRHDDYPPLLLYGQRRMGKTSFLYQLRWLLPSTIVALVVDLQGPVALATSHASFLINLARGIKLSASQQQFTVPEIDHHAFKSDPFTQFDMWLDQFKSVLQTQGIQSALLAFDEFESLDVALQRGTLEPDAVLGTLRHIIQHRTFFRLMLAGSHTLNEFQRWSSFLINAQTIHISYLSQQETQHLITKPIPDYPLQFEPEALDCIWHLASGHPYLTQLVCMELVASKNEQPVEQRTCATKADVDAVIPAVLERGQQFFADIERNQISAESRQLLKTIAQKNGQFVLADGGISAEKAQHLCHELETRELIHTGDNQIRFQVELVRHWFLS